jgi:hypothetical protein
VNQLFFEHISRATEKFTQNDNSSLGLHIYLKCCAEKTCSLNPIQKDNKANLNLTDPCANPEGVPGNWTPKIFRGRVTGGLDLP